MNEKGFSQGEIDNALIDRALRDFGDMLKNRLALSRQYETDIRIGTDNPIPYSVFQSANDLVEMTFRQVCSAGKWMPPDRSEESSSIKLSALFDLHYGILQPPKLED